MPVSRCRIDRADVIWKRYHVGNMNGDSGRSMIILSDGSGRCAADASRRDRTPWRRAAAGDPVEQVDVGAVEQGFEPIELGAVETCEEIVGERAEKKVDLLRAAVPGAKQGSPASSIRISTAHAVGSAVGAIDDMCAVGRQGFQSGWCGVACKFGSAPPPRTSPRWGAEGPGAGETHSRRCFASALRQVRSAFVTPYSLLTSALR